MVAARRLARKPPRKATAERLLVEAARADLSKFDALYELHFARLYLFIVGRVHNRATAEDLTSEVFHRALANLSTYEWRGTSFAAWLYRIASNAIADQYKRANRERSGNADTLGSPTRANIYSKKTESVDRGAFLFRLVEELPEIQRQVVCERFIEERSIKEIAQRLSKT